MPVDATFCKNELKKNLYRKAKFTRARSFRDAYYVLIEDYSTRFLLRNYGDKCVVWQPKYDNDSSFRTFYSNRYENITDFLNAIISDIDL